MLPHQLRHGGETKSWYHGPLTSGCNPDDIDSLNLPIRASDQLLRFDTTLGMFDVSYAAAWELGRMLMLSNTPMAMKLFSWKRHSISKLKSEEQNLLHGHMPFANNLNAGNEQSVVDESLGNWLSALSLLHHVPFNYLVPDKELLPSESIRFFTLDNLWLESLKDGALSIGRVSEPDRQHDVATISQDTEPKLVSGFLLRSEVVCGWPGLLVDAWSQAINGEDIPDNKSPLDTLRKEKIAPDIMLYLFPEKIETVDIHLKAESIHFGFDRPDDDHPDFYKTLKNIITGETDQNAQTSEIIWLNKDCRIVDISALNQDISNKCEGTGKLFTSAKFAFEMIEGIPRARFRAQNNSGQNT